ncbi:MAG: acyl-CoA desaturase [Xanthomonadales bacterium]|nr:acyl-CoA desaturase [Xanthomonadales bacterium]
MNPDHSHQQEAAPINWTVSIVLGLSFLVTLTVVPWYALSVGFSGWAWLCFGLFLVLNGVGIGSGYNRLWSHRAYRARTPQKLFLPIFGGMAMQNSILVWCARHRIHHRDVDDNDSDPYSIGRGFWFAHIGWMLRDYESGRIDYSVVPDLQRDPVVAWQHRNYWTLVWATNLGLPLLAGWLTGEWLGMFLLAGVARLTVNHHVTFFVNSLAHIWGRQPYTDENSARDNWFVALLTYGEGYHNYHHLFQNDYRNGIRWWQFDINKWFIAICASLGLASSLKRAPRFKVLRARLNMEFKRARQRLAEQQDDRGWREALESEYAEFMETVKRWQALQVDRVQQGRAAFAKGLNTRFKELEFSLKMQRKRLALLTAQLSV